MECLVFGFLVVLLTAVWVFCTKNQSFQVLAYAMYFPGLVAVVWSAANGNLFQFVHRILGMNQTWPRSLLLSLVSVCIVYYMVEACALVSVKLGWAKKVKAKTEDKAVHPHNRHWLYGYLRAAGEEVGWRCFLLPCLLDSYSPFTALLISGLIWGLFHVPVMVLLTGLLKPSRPYATVAVQCTACMFAAFVHGWVAINSGFTIWAPSIMHWFWNKHNPRVLGSIYMNTPGQYMGEQWKINGEGLVGCIVQAPVVAAMLLQIYYMPL